MYVPLCSKLGLTATGTRSSEVSQPVSMDGFDAAQVECTVFSGGVTVDVEGSHDLENWYNIATPTSSSTAPNFVYPAQTGITYAYIRVQWSSDGTATTLAGGVTLSKQG